MKTSTTLAETEIITPATPVGILTEAGARLFACKVAFYLDPLTKDTGCLRIIPGSQNPAHFVRAEKIDPNQSQALYGLHPRDFPTSVALESNPGDVVIFNHDTYHAAFGGRNANDACSR